MIRALVLSLALVTPGFAQEQKPPGQPLSEAEAAKIGTLRWMAEMRSYQTSLRDAGRLMIAPGGVIAADPLTWDAQWSLPVIDVPAGEARFLLALEPEQGRVAQAMLIFSDDAVICGDDVATIPVDTGLATFLDTRMQASIAGYYKTAEPEDDLYSAWLEPLIGETWVVGHILALPDKTLIPITSSGWGDGGYPVARLRNAAGEVVAIYADFNGRNDEGEWLLPPACATT